MAMSRMRERQQTTGSVSLDELRRYLLRRASRLAVRARACRTRGDVVTATRMSEEAARLLRVARDMRRAGPA
jgi:hypothetical protein